MFISDDEKVILAGEAVPIIVAHEKAHLRAALTDAGCQYGQLRVKGHGPDDARMLVLAQVRRWYDQPEAPSTVTGLAHIGNAEKVQLADGAAVIPESDHGGMVDLGVQFGWRVQAGAAFGYAFREAGAWLVSYYGGENPWPGSSSGGGTPGTGDGRRTQGFIRRFGSMAVGDNNGPRNYVGLSRFTWLGDMKRDPDRVYREMDADVAAGFGYARVLLQVDNMGGSHYWDNREARHTWSDHEALVAMLHNAARERGLLLLDTLIGKGGGVDYQHVRVPYVQRMADVLKNYPDVVLTAEMVNEPGVGGEISASQILELERIFKGTAPSILTATGAVWTTAETNPGSDAGTQGGTAFSPEAWHRTQGQIGIVHHDRDTSKSEQQDRPWRQPWDVGLEGKPWVDNEPIGPGASVNTETRPLVLRSHRLVNFISRAFATCYHTDAGVRGLHPVEDSPGYRDQAAATRFLPGDIVNGSPQNANASYPGRHWDIPNEHLRALNGNRAGIVRAYGVSYGGDQYTVPFGPLGEFELLARRPLHVKCYQQDVNDLLWERQVAASERIRFTADHPDYLVVSTSL